MLNHLGSELKGNCRDPDSRTFSKVLSRAWQDDSGKGKSDGKRGLGYHVGRHVHMHKVKRTSIVLPDINFYSFSLAHLGTIQVLRGCEYLEYLPRKCGLCIWQESLR